MSWKPQIKTIGSEGWHDNATRFATEEEAKLAGADIHARWMLAEDYRAVECDDPVNYQIKDGVMNPVEGAQ